MKKLFSFILGAFVGGLIGGVLALLLAPASGEQLRSQIRQRGVSFTAEVQNAAAQRRAELEARLAELRTPRSISLPPEQ